MDKKIYKYTSSFTNEKHIYFVLLGCNHNTITGEIIFSEHNLYRIGHKFVFAEKHIKKLNQEEINNLNKLITFL
jgi:hypothetical protein